MALDVQLLKAMEVSHAEPAPGIGVDAAVLQQGVHPMTESVDEGDGADLDVATLDVVEADYLATDLTERTHNLVLDFLHILLVLDGVRIADDLQDAVAMVPPEVMGGTVAPNPSQARFQVFIEPFLGFLGCLVHALSGPTEIEVVPKVYPVFGLHPVDELHDGIERVLASKVAVVVAHSDDVVFIAH